jgi:N,N-dimethylformamidase beta subunit-like protein
MALAFYTDVTSGRAGDVISLYASSSIKHCTLEIARAGASRQVVSSLEISVGFYETPIHADRLGCGWPQAAVFTIGADWPSGYYDLLLRNSDGDEAHHLICVKPHRVHAPAALILATNTYHAYNWWGGANAYCDVTKLMAREQTLDAAMEGAIGTLSTRRPFVPLLVAAPSNTPRLVNLRARGFREPPFAGDREWARSHRLSPYDRSAGFLNKWEHIFAAWAEANAIALDYFTDYDVETEPEALAGYRCLIVVGHSEYWSAAQRMAIERFVDEGGNLAILSGNTCFWKVRWEETGTSLICHKWRGLEAEPSAGFNATHLWSHPAFHKPEAELTGLSFLFGGYHRLGGCVARGAGAYTVYRDRHWALEGCDLSYGDQIGEEIPLLGYENDGCRFVFDDDGLPAPIPSLGVPANLEIIALAPCAFGEEADRGYRPLIPPEKLDICAEIVFGDASERSQKRLLRGHAVMASFKRGRGEVFNAGTTEWVYGLKANNSFVDRITRNVLHRFCALP